MGSLPLDRRAAIWESLWLKRDDRPLSVTVGEPRTIPKALGHLSEFERLVRLSYPRDVRACASDHFLAGSASQARL